MENFFFVQWYLKEELCQLWIFLDILHFLADTYFTPKQRKELVGNSSLNGETACIEP